MENNDILSKIGHRDGMTVPDGYFDDFNRRMEASLPEMPWEKAPQVLPRTFWQKVRPYVYMAAMFAGVWCMMKMFEVTRPSTGLLVEPSPALISAVSNDAFFNDYYATEVDESDLYDDLFDEGFQPVQFDESATN